MSGHPRVWLLQTPSPDAEAWRQTFSAACTANGWNFASQSRGQDAPEIDHGRPVLIAGWLYETGEQAVVHRIVQFGGPAAAEQMSRTPDGVSFDRDFLQEASLRLCVAHELAIGGARVVPMDAPVLPIPGLGELARPDPVHSLPVSQDGPLSFFDQLPLADHATARWSTDLFSYADPAVSDGRMPLIGRRRLLFNGPNIYLPKGRWRFRAEFSLHPGTDADLLIEWGFGHEVQSLPVVISRPGRYEVELVQTWSGTQPADFRMSLMTPLLAGTLDFHGGVLTRMPDDDGAVDYARP